MGYSLSERDSHGEVGEKNDIASYLWKHKEGRMGKIYREESAMCEKQRERCRRRKEKNPPKETNGKMEFLTAVEFRVWNIIVVLFFVCVRKNVLATQ